MIAIFTKSNANSNKWLLRAGSLLILATFFMPGLSNTGYSLSIGQMTVSYGPISFVFIGSFTSIVLSYLPPKNDWQRFYFILGEAGGLGVGILVLVYTSLNITSVAPLFNTFTSIGWGIYVLILGYIIAGLGVAMGFFQSPNYADSSDGFSSNSGPRLELMSGNAPAVVLISSADFSIGRSRQNDFSCKDPQVSRMHARIREAQGAWFIQDQNSASGTFVNGKRIQAQRLSDGDQIRFGKTIFRFHL